jgi:integrase
MATVTRKVKGGKWYAIFADQHGKQKWKTGYTDKAETQRLADRLEDEARKIRLGDIDPQHEARKIERAKGIRDHLTQYRISLEAAGRDRNHVSYTIKDIEQFIDFAAVTNAANVTRPRVDEWVLAMIKEKADSNSTINRRVGSLQAFLKHLHGQGVLTSYVLHKYPKLKTGGKHTRRKVRALDEQEIKLLLDTAPADRVEIYRFALLSGARYSAIVDLKVGDLNFAAGTMALKKKTKSGGASVYVVDIHPTLVPVLKRLTEGKSSDAPVFAVMRRENAAKFVREDAAKGKVETKGVGFHCLRHTFITGLALLNVHPKIAQELAGHSSLEITLGYYTHFQRADKLQALKMLKW